MINDYKSENVWLMKGDCLERMKELPGNSIDSIVTDPPYGLSFMGKKWDYDVPSEEIWAECLRVLKPGGHLLAFAGTRTQHRMAVRIEDAGFEIRDVIAWVYGSGFPKSLDVSKAIDKQDAAEARLVRRFRFTEWMRSTGLTAVRIDAITSTNMGNHYTTHPTQPAVATREYFEMLRPHFGCDVPAWVEQLVDERTVESENMKRREVLATETRYNEASGIVSAGRDERTLVERKITAAHTAPARQWQGWGTALKPALEPITVARKPLIGTVAANVLEHGTGALNIDGCRVETNDGDNRARPPRTPNQILGGDNGANITASEHNDAGRWPANLIHDGSDEVVNLTGDAARFFYCAKASKKDRGEGNIHPTVKPTDLMRYLCRLVTPPNGCVLDPFAGSGSTGKAAISESLNFIGIEMDDHYFEIAKARILAD